MDTPKEVETKIAALSYHMRQCSDLLDSRNRMQHVVRIHKLLGEIEAGVQWLKSPIRGESHESS